MVTLRLHSCLGEEFGNEWHFNAKSVSECLHALQTRTKKFYKYLLDQDKKNTKYAVIVNGENFHTEETLDLDHVENIKNCELVLNRTNLKTIDIVPILEGSDSKALGIITAILGVILIIIGIVLLGTPAAPASIPLITIGLGLIAAGVASILAKPPKFEDFREVEQGGKTSYLFSGPQNIVGEGGPVPVGYGNLLIGSQVIAAAYVIRDFSANDSSRVIRDEFGNLVQGAKGQLKYTNGNRRSNQYLF